MICAGEGDQVLCLVEIELASKPGLRVVEIARPATVEPLPSTWRAPDAADAWLSVWLAIFAASVAVMFWSTFAPAEREHRVAAWLSHRRQARGEVAR